MSSVLNSCVSSRVARPPSVRALRARPRVHGCSGGACVHACAHRLGCFGKEHTGHRQCRAVGRWCEARGFDSSLRLSGLPGVPLCLCCVCNKNLLVSKWHAVLWPLRD